MLFCLNTFDRPYLYFSKYIGHQYHAALWIMDASLIVSLSNSPSDPCRCGCWRNAAPNLC